MFGSIGRRLQVELCPGVDESDFVECLGEDNAFVEYSEISATQGVCPALAFAEEITVNCGVELCDLPCNATLPFGFDQENFT